MQTPISDLIGSANDSAEDLRRAVKGVVDAFADCPPGEWPELDAYLVRVNDVLAQLDAANAEVPASVARAAGDEQAEYDHAAALADRASY